MRSLHDPHSYGDHWMNGFFQIPGRDHDVNFRKRGKSQISKKQAGIPNQYFKIEKNNNILI